MSRHIFDLCPILIAFKSVEKLRSCKIPILAINELETNCAKFG
jgi:hypothetical protein